MGDFVASLRHQHSVNLRRSLDEQSSRSVEINRMRTRKVRQQLISAAWEMLFVTAFAITFFFVSTGVNHMWLSYKVSQPVNDHLLGNTSLLPPTPVAPVANEPAEGTGRQRRQLRGIDEDDAAEGSFFDLGVYDEAQVWYYLREVLGSALLGPTLFGPCGSQGSEYEGTGGGWVSSGRQVFR